MGIKRPTYGFFLLTLALLAWHCAKQAAPQGGARDVTPPVVIKSTPPQGTTGFSSKGITIVFDEYITLDKINEKFMVSPPMEAKPKIYLKGKELKIDFLEKLRDSTTYTLYFQDAIKDLNEGNAIPNFQYVFSTGNVIDSLSVTGNVLLAENLEPEKSVMLMLHSVLSDTAPVKILPDYITMGDINGGFRINNIREGNYRLYALSDKNNNKRYDLEDEIFAFYDSVLNINPANSWHPEKPDTTVSKIDEKIKADLKMDEKQIADVKKELNIKKEVPEIDGKYKMFIFTGPKKARYLTSSSRKLPYQLLYTLSLPPDTLKFDFTLAETDNKNFFIETSRRRDTVTVWLLDSALYSKPQIKTIVTYPFTDTTGAVISKPDTIEMRFVAPKPTRGKQRAKPLSYSNNIPVYGMKPGQTILFTSITPLEKPDTSKIRLYETSAKSRIPVKYQLLADTLNKRRLIMKTQLKEGGRYLLITDSAAFRNIYGDLSDSTGTSFTVREATTFGHLKLDIRNGTGSLVVQLLDEKEKLVTERKMVNGGIADFPLLEKGIYRARVIYDLNNDGIWTTGDFKTKRQPEPVSYYKEQIEMRVNFEETFEWDVSVMYEKPKSLRAKREGSNL
jgi:hypothetical protein